MKSMLLIAAGIAVTIACWGMYGPAMHEGQAGLGGNRLKPLICVGLAYFLVAIVVPTAFLISQGQLKGGWSSAGVSWSLAAGAVGAIGAMGIILAFTSGGKTIYVMPLVFGGAPVVNTFISMYWSKSWKDGINPIFFLGLALVIIGSATVLTFAPKPSKTVSAQPALTESATQTPPAGH